MIRVIEFSVSAKSVSCSLFIFLKTVNQQILLGRKWIFVVFEFIRLFFTENSTFETTSSLQNEQKYLFNAIDVRDRQHSTNHTIDIKPVHVLKINWIFDQVSECQIRIRNSDINLFIYLNFPLSIYIKMSQKETGYPDFRHIFEY